MDPSDQTLLNEWYQNGDAEAFHQITRRYAGLVYGTCRRILRNSNDAEDVAQECFETLAVKTRADGSALGAWLHTVATRRALEKIKMESRRRDREHRAVAAQPAHDTTDWDEIYPIVDQAIAALPEKERVPLVAHFLEGQTHGEVAERMGISRSTASYRIQKGLERIRRELRRCGITRTTAAVSTALGAGLAAEAVPAALIAGLGKISVSSLPAMGNAASSVITTTIAGSIAMKKGLIVVAVIVALAGGIGLATHKADLQPVPVDVSAVISPPEVAAVAVDPVGSAWPEFPAADSAPADALPASEADPRKPSLPDKSDAGVGSLAISGRVVDASQTPVSGVFVEVQQPVIANTYTAENGSFRLTGLAAGLHYFHAKKDGYSDQSLEVEAGDMNLSVVLQGLASVSGRVVDGKTGAVVPEFTISSYRGMVTQTDPSKACERHSVNDPDGRFELSSVDRAGTTLFVEATGYATSVTTLERTTDESLRDLTIAIQPGASVDGIVTDAAGNPVAGAWVLFSPANVPSPSQSPAYLRRVAEEENDPQGKTVIGGWRAHRM